MELIKNKKQYWEFIRNLRNHEEVKTGFIQQENITALRHYMHMMLREQCYYICLVEEKPAGYVGVIEKDIRVATHPDFQGQGVGKFMINELMKIHPNAFAKVKLENEASMRLFKACGFKEKYYILEKE